jgi:hypothetical protein
MCCEPDQFSKIRDLKIAGARQPASRKRKPAAILTGRGGKEIQQVVQKKPNLLNVALRNAAHRFLRAA